jgi:hypothetical protein
MDERTVHVLLPLFFSVCECAVRAPFAAIVPTGGLLKAKKKK